MGQCGPHVHFSSTYLGMAIAWRIAATQGGASVFSTFTEGAGVGELANLYWLQIGSWRLVLC